MHRLLPRLGVVLLVARLAFDVATPWLPGAFVFEPSAGIESIEVWNDRAAGREAPAEELVDETRKPVFGRGRLSTGLTIIRRPAPPVRRIEHPLRLPAAFRHGPAPDRSPDH